MPPRAPPTDRSKPSRPLQSSIPPRATPPPRLLFINKFAESRAPELESLHSIVSDRLNHDFRQRRDKRRRTTGFRRGKNFQRKRSQLGYGDAAADGRGGTEASDGKNGGGEADASDGKARDGKEKKCSRRVRRRLELRRNPAVGFCASGDGTKRLRTHLWHAKRFTIVKRWGFYLPLGVHGRGKGSRAVLKRLKSGALIHDASYSHPVQLEGREEDILGIMRMVLSPLPSDVSGQKYKAVIYGSFYANSVLYHSRLPHAKFIAPVLYMWRPPREDESYVDPKESSAGGSLTRSECSTSFRQLWIWIHAASYNEGFNALSCACQKLMKETGFFVKCISMEGNIGRLEVIGEKSVKILQKILKPLPKLNGAATWPLLSCSALRACSNSRVQTLVLDPIGRCPSHAILSLIVQDPRNLPSDQAKFSQRNCCLSLSPLQNGLVQDSTAMLSSEESTEENNSFLSLLSMPESNEVLFSDCKKLWESSIKIKPPLPEDIICLQKHHERLKHFYLESAEFGESAGSATDDFDRSCPLILLKHPVHGKFNSGWSVILPLCWVKPFWMSFISNGAHAIGIREKRWIACSNGLPSFPYDFPDSIAYSSLMVAESAAADEAANLRPPAVRPIPVPLEPPWDCIAHTLSISYKVDESQRTSYLDFRDFEGLPSKQAEEPFEISIPRTSNHLIHLLKEQGQGLYFVRVLIHAYKEGSFEEGAVVCAPALADLPAWKPRSEDHEPLQMPQSFIKSYFTKQESGKWQLQLPQESSIPHWYRWPIGFITTGFVRGSSKPLAVGFCELRLLKWLKEQQAKEIELTGPEILVLVRNLRSSTYRRALATIVLEMQEEDLLFM
ncbi:ribonuclease P/MRP protein subunit POP1 [Apostasia shenzhenica]|uniref:Ribonuclease P/MRP protein subunit POP1 n=1 Tax=Apostasia shenzhenica TaxID=1088818 RepID=A0A2I0A7R9_9ASPA|nr:ribonuclease P/MRP protein subunit POP1 [Apostasia shenzhenica]